MPDDRAKTAHPPQLAALRPLFALLRWLADRLLIFGRRRPADATKPAPKAPEHAPQSKKVNRKWVPSPYRDAKFRPLFQALGHLEAARRAGETTVIYSTPSHPTFPMLHLPTNALTTPYPLMPEPLDDITLHRETRHWSAFNARTPRQHATPADWRELSDAYRLEWLHHAMRAAGLVSAFTVNLDDATEARIRQQHNSIGWLAKRIARRLQAALGRKVPLWFTLELSATRRLHVHGEFAVAGPELPAARKALRLACGEWKVARQHQAKTHEHPDALWPAYCAKDAWQVRPLSPAMQEKFPNWPRPINGDWIFATNDVRSRAEVLYRDCREHVIYLLKDIMIRRREVMSD